MTRRFTKIEELQGVERIAALSLLAEENPGNALVISEVLRSFANRLESGDIFSSGEVKFLAGALRRVSQNVERYGHPFGFKKGPGRPGKVNALERLALGKRVDELHHPNRHGLSDVPLQLTDNSSGPGAYSRVAEEFGLDEKLVERAYGAYLRRIKRR
jgi:hypothetical protein